VFDCVTATLNIELSFDSAAESATCEDASCSPALVLTCASSACVRTELADSASVIDLMPLHSRLQA
jgi:hypothetical protein